MDVVVASSSFLVSSSTVLGGASAVSARVPQPWSLLAHQRNSRHPPSQRQAETSSSSTYPAAEGMCEGGSVGIPAGAVVTSPCGLMDAQEGEETALHSPIVSTACVAWRVAPKLFLTTEPSERRGSADGGDCDPAAAAGEGGGGGYKLLAFLQRHASPWCHGEEAESALGVFAAVLKLVREVHLSRCPLCAPRHPPNWWTSVRDEKRYREILHDRHNREVKKIRQHEDVNGGGDTENDEDSELGALGRSRILVDGAVGDAERRLGWRQQLLPTLETWSTKNGFQLSLAGAHQRLRLEAVAFLEHVYSRREHLHATRPVMYSVRLDAHLLRRECAALGGIVLLEALLLGL
ncbi:hypothetical protein TraAM80_02949 [Trypanosoma rangeli]|uniref:Uncharacterized protein n=1 Tax=Trypanosoma rangeli TaxID=5698 RepID=A0A3R7M2T1_TRYRA|nr:uncharacterized protein TraAM80_02949 [Trypanosoma rangeli]RNF08017.1 hypothetical protein TraAM80_02949 [Trypanosoma rangeli]|eukprot:RNF08017.1 hypothetical protein TraAM80_02949 [Trypanosoma rangeli]